MRETYGKMMYSLMDSAEPEIEELLGFRCGKTGASFIIIYYYSPST